MGFNYAREKAKFEAEWKKKADLYRSAGMSEESIQILRNDAWNEFKSDRNYDLHTQELPEDQRINTSYFLSLTITASEEELTGRYDFYLFSLPIFMKAERTDKTHSEKARSLKTEITMAGAVIWQTANETSWCASG